ncbi:hypothetical protein PAHAL_3G493000 [Panicum hallii]|jgi:hypothetical protein|uniref:Uncharacterized protein n=1 Tax=Panicum hallii TaxID=206008 RepID=A0A2S3HFF7_9POAL|nr:uncharacterized protein LOC112884485 [Panicum hallii]PAN21833.1 hypothetical protein PAHAL_3G493000 [Panicum hallii]
MDHHRRRRSRPAATVAATLCLVLALGGRCGAAARPLRRLHAVEGSTESAASEAVLDVTVAEAPEAARWSRAAGSEGSQDDLGAGKWLPLPMPMPMSMPAASALAGGLRFPPVSFPLAGASMPWLSGAPPAFAGMPALVPPYVGATRQEQLSLWASLFNPFQVRPRLPGALGGETAAAGSVERGGVPAIASGGKAAEGETMDVPAAAAAQVAEPKWGVFLGNIDRRN